MVAKKLYKHPWEESLPQPTHVNKVLVHEEAVVFHYDDINGDDVVFALDIGKRGSIKVLWQDKVGCWLVWHHPRVYNECLFCISFAMWQRKYK